MNRRTFLQRAISAAIGVAVALAAAREIVIRVGPCTGKTTVFTGDICTICVQNWLKDLQMAEDAQFMRLTEKIT